MFGLYLDAAVDVELLVVNVGRHGKEVVNSLRQVPVEQTLVCRHRSHKSYHFYGICC